MEKKSSKKSIYEDLKKKIIYCEMLPSTPISEEELCELYNVSRTPIREVFLELSREGYITIESRKSTKVSKISFQEMNEIIESRLLIEPYIIRNLKEKIEAGTIDQLEEMKKRFDAISLDDTTSFKKYLELDYEFHCLLVSLSKNQLMIEFCKNILERSIRQWYLMYARMEGRLMTAINEHEGIINLLIKEDYISAAKEIEKHINAFYDLVYFN